MSLARLADVEVQLIMQSLDVCSRLRLARSSRALFHSADHPFAWVGSSLKISSGQVCQRKVDAESRLLRHVARVTVTWRRGDCVCDGTGREFMLALYKLLPFLPVHELYIMDRLGKRGWSLFNATNFDALRVLVIKEVNTLSVKNVAQISKLRRLNTLRVEYCATTNDAWAALPDAPALTSLQITDRLGVEFTIDHSSLKFVRHCKHLTHLDIFPLGFNANILQQAFVSSYESPFLHRQLQSLRLESVNCSWEFSPAACALAFQSLCVLHTITLAIRHGIELVLPHLVHAPALRDLIAEEEEQANAIFYKQDQPFFKIAIVSPLCDLLVAASNLQCTFRGLVPFDVREALSKQLLAQPSVLDRVHFSP